MSRKYAPALDDPARKQACYRTPTASLGRCLVGGLDDVADALALGEGEKFS